MLTSSKDLRTGQPYWRSLPVPRVTSGVLTRDITTDVVVVGAGITGAMTAQALAATGMKVAMLDRRGPMLGASSATTALLQYEIDTPMVKLVRQIGEGDTMRAWRRSKLALEGLSGAIQALGIRCDNERRCSLYLAGDMLDAAQLKKEAELRLRTGFHTEYLTRDALREKYGLRRNAALLSFNNMTVNPLRMTAGFLRAAQDHGATIYAPVVAEHIEPGAQDVRVHTKDGPVVKARHLVFAAGYEIPKLVDTKKHKILSTYAITTKKQRGKLWPGECLIWEASDPYLYVRSTADGRVICGGEDEDFSDEDARDALLAAKTITLQKKLAELLPDIDATADYAWCGSFGSTNTGLPSIGALPGLERCYGILAFGGNGITFARIAAELLRTQLTGGTDPDADLFAF